MLNGPVDLPEVRELLLAVDGLPEVPEVCPVNYHIVAILSSPFQPPAEAVPLIRALLVGADQLFDLRMRKGGPGAAAAAFQQWPRTYLLSRPKPS